MIMILTALALTISSCDSIPKEHDSKIIERRDQKILKSKEQLCNCLPDGRGAALAIHFKLFRNSYPLFSKPELIPYNPETGEDELTISQTQGSAISDQAKSCITEEIRQLKFKAVYYTVPYMDEHRYMLVCSEPRKSLQDVD